MTARVAIAAAALVLGASAPARAEWGFRTDADKGCPQIIVGRCGQFAAGWRPPMLRLELGPVAQHTSIGPMIGEDDNGALTGRIRTGGPVDARGVGFRVVAGYLGYYLAMDTAISWRLLEAPAVEPIGAAAARGEAPVTGARDGAIAAMKLGLGREVRAGRLMLGAELGVGLGVVFVGAAPQPYVPDARFVLDARAHAGVWLTPHVSVSGFASASLFRENERTFGISLGLALFPWDGTRSR
ncbi:MAG: hypothetical protein KF773_28660 [Deltaproteobacteria bacterium]|nr:hypothetical protein [Deltaproteobacteria bacterium]